MAEQKKAARRNFFAGLGLVTAAAAAAKLTPSVPGASVESNSVSDTQDPHSQGYRLSEHVKKYYRTTTI